MNRRVFFAALAGATAAPAADDTCPVRILVDAGPSITVYVPNIAKQDLVGIAATFLGREHPAPTKDLGRLLGGAKHITLTLTTKCESEQP